MTIILGAGLAGLSSSYHLNSECEIFEKQGHSGGHIYSHKIDDFTWDEGPHISFTKNDYVKDLFSKNVDGEYLEYEVNLSNYYKGHWIPHPAQTNLFAIPEPVRTECLNSFLSSRSEKISDQAPVNYKEWLLTAFGEKFANEFPTAYTNKYWTTPPENLTADWVGNRMYYPAIDDVKSGYEKPPVASKNYITVARYPKNGGFFSFAQKLKKSATIYYNKEALKIDLRKKKITFSDESEVSYTRLINTIALPEFVLKTSPPPEVADAARALSCSELLLINVIANHDPRVKNQWIYIYDEDKYSTRISFTDLFSAENGQKGKCGIQVEVYFSKYRERSEPESEIIKAVCNELVEMGLVANLSAIDKVSTINTKYANVIFDLGRKKAMDTIYNYLSEFGLKRETDDLDAGTLWQEKLKTKEQFGSLIMAGRYAQWKYFWTDDCVLRGLQISQNI